MSYIFGKFGVSNLSNDSGTTGTVNRQIVFAGGSNVTLSQSVNASSATVTVNAGFRVSAGGASGNLAAVTFSNSNGIGFGLNGSTITASHNGITSQTNQSLGLYAVGNVTQGSSTALDARTLSFNGLGGVSVGYSNGSVLISGGAGGGGGGIALANSQTTYTSGTANLNVVGGAMTIASTTGQSFNFSVPQTSSLSATGAFSISSNGSTVSMGVPAFSAGISNIGNTSGTSGTASNQVVFAGGNNVTLSQATGAGGNTITISAGAGGAIPNLLFYQNLAPQNSVQPYATLGLIHRTLLVQPLSPLEGLGFPGNMTISTFMMHLSGSQTATSATTAWSSSFSSSMSVGIYNLVNSSQISLVNSASTSWSAPANTQNSTMWAGPRFLTIHSSQWSAQPVLSAGERYWYGIAHNSSNFSNMGPSWIGQYIGASTQRSGTIGVSQVVNTSQGMVPFLGIYATSVTSMPASIANSQINKVNVSAGFMPSVILNASFSAF